MAQANKSAWLPETRKYTAAFSSTRERQTQPFHPCVVGIGTLAHLQTKAKTNHPEVVRCSVEASTAVHQRTINPINLPQDIVDIIVADLGDDIQSLKAVSTTCRSWYLAAAPYLHNTLTIGVHLTRVNLESLPKLHKLGLLTFVKKLWIRSPAADVVRISPRRLDRKILQNFSAFTNVQQLRIDWFNLSDFFPDIGRYFGHFAPALRSISLKILSGTPQQILCFLALFPYLDDIEIEGYLDVTLKPNPELMGPFSAPSLRGQLKLMQSW